MKIFIINLERSPERKKQMTTCLKALHLEFDFFTAIDGKNLTDEEIKTVCDHTKIRKNINREITKNEIACALSHRAVYKKIVDEKIPRAIILEDDIVLSDDFVNVIEHLPQIKNSVIKLDNPANRKKITSLWYRKKVYKNYYLKKPATIIYLTWGYCIDNYAAQTILKKYPRIEFCADDWFKMQKNISLYVLRPEIVFEQEILSASSTIGNDRILDPKPLYKKIIERIVYLTIVFFKTILP